MNSKIFYSNKKIRDLERPFLNPELSEDSDLSSESDESIYIYIYISESEKDYEDSSEFLESHSQSDFSESNDEPVIKPNPLPQPKTGASKKNKMAMKKTTSLTSFSCL